MVTLLPIVSEPVKPVPIKAPVPIEVTELGMASEPVRPVQSVKATSPIVVTELPSDKPVKLMQKPKAPSPIVVTELGMFNEPVKPVQPMKAEVPIVVRELPRVNELLKLLQYWKA